MWTAKLIDETTNETMFLVSEEVDGTYIVRDLYGRNRVFVGFMPIVRFCERNGLVYESLL